MLIYMKTKKWTAPFLMEIPKARLNSVFQNETPPTMTPTAIASPLPAHLYYLPAIRCSLVLLSVNLDIPPKDGPIVRLYHLTTPHFVTNKPPNQRQVSELALRLLIRLLNTWICRWDFPNCPKSRLNVSGYSTWGKWGIIREPTTAYISSFRI